MVIGLSWWPRLRQVIQHESIGSCYDLAQSLLFIVSCMHGMLYNPEFDVLLACRTCLVQAYFDA